MFVGDVISSGAVEVDGVGNLLDDLTVLGRLGKEVHESSSCINLLSLMACFILSWFSLLLVCVFIPFASSAVLVAGNLIALRVGSGSALTTSSTPIFLDEITAGTGAVAQTISVPSTGGTPCTLSGVGDGEGLLTRSFDGAVASFACYGAESN